MQTSCNHARLCSCHVIPYHPLLFHNMRINFFSEKKIFTVVNKKIDKKYKQLLYCIVLYCIVL